MIYDISQSVAVSAYSIAVKTISTAIAGVLFPKIASHFTFKKLIIWSQVFSGVLVLLLLLHWKFSAAHSVILIFGILFFQSFLKQLFEGAREARSRVLGEIGEQRTLQAQIMHGFYAAQFCGPIISFFLIRYIDLSIPLILDCMSFFVAALMARNVGEDLQLIKFKIIAPFKYLSKNPELKKIFLIRSIGMWIPISAFNYISFPIVTEHYGLKLIQSAWVYVAVGFGSMIATSWLKSSHAWLKKQNDWKVVSISFIVLAISRIFFANLPSFYLAILVLIIGGFCNGLNATLTQAIRRKASTPEQLPEVIGLELFVGRLTDYFVASILFILLGKNLITPETGIYFSAAGFLVLAYFSNTSKNYI
jgi:predicted MFS family arabinose efflux permease